MAIGRGTTKTTLVGSRALKSRRWLSINEENNCRDRLGPRVWREISGNEKGTSCLKNMAVLTLSHTILSVSIRA